MNTVFATFGLNDPATEQRKSDLTSWLQDVIDERDLAVADAADLVGLSASDLGKLLRGRTGDYTVADLREMLAALQSDEG